VNARPGARLKALLAGEKPTRHGTDISPGGPGQVRIERQVCADDRDTERSDA
jgi:hypothetical protein